MIGFIGKLWASDCLEQGYNLLDVYRAFGMTIKRLQKGKPIRWQDEKFKYGLMFFCCEVEYMAFHYGHLSRKPHKAKGASFLKHNFWPRQYTVLKACHLQRKKTFQTEKIAAIELYLAGCDLIRFYAYRGIKRAQDLVEIYGMNI